MKKRFCIFLVALLMLLAVPAAAAAQPCVMDEAGLLSDAQREMLESEAARLGEEYGVGIYVAAIDDFQEYASSVRSAAEVYYKEKDLGLGETKGGILLMLSMFERDYALIAYGHGNDVLTDYGREKMIDAFLGYFGENDWAGGFASYLTTAERYLSMESRGSAFDSDTDVGLIDYLIFLVLIPLGLAFVVTGIMKKKMNKAVKAVSADNYVVGTGLALTAQQDIFAGRFESRQVISTPSSRGTSVNSGGFSGSSGKF